MDEDPHPERPRPESRPGGRRCRTRPARACGRPGRGRRTARPRTSTRLPGCRPARNCCASGNRRASMTMKASAWSATDSAFFPGVVTTGMPRSVAAAVSTLTGPPRAQQTRRSVGRGEDAVGDRRAVHDEHLVAVQRPRDLLRVARVLVDPELGLARGLEGPRLVDLEIRDVVGAAQARQPLREHLGRDVAVADDEDPHPPPTPSRGTRATALPGAPLPPTSFSGRNTSHAPVAGT